MERLNAYQGHKAILSHRAGEKRKHIKLMGSQSSYDHGTPSPARILDNILKVLKDSKYQGAIVKQY